MQTLTPLPHYQPDLDMAMTSDMPNLFGSPGEWGHSSHTFAKRPHANYLELSIPDLRNSRREYPLQQHINDMKSVHTPMDSAMPTYDGFTHSGELDPAAETRHYPAANMYVPQPTFTALNTPNGALQTPQHEIVSPLQAGFGASFHSSPSFSNDALHSAASSTFGSISGHSTEAPSNKRRRDSTWTDVSSTGGDNPPSPPKRPTGGRRKSEHVEPGSARAIYLEKNRKTASKCRGKQRMQQQELVETARDMERRNKQLKAEVEFLKSDMRDLMAIVGRHSDCPDGRLRTYVQREADRLVSKKQALSQHQHHHHHHHQQLVGGELFPSQHSSPGHSPQ